MVEAKSVVCLLIYITLTILSFITMGCIATARKNTTGKDREKLDHAYNAVTGIAVMSAALLSFKLYKEFIGAKHSSGGYFD